MQATLSGATVELVLRKAEAWERWPMDTQGLQLLQLHRMPLLDVDRMHIPLRFHLECQLTCSEFMAEREGGLGPRSALGELKANIKAS
jgi:hypothetical protein